MDLAKLFQEKENLPPKKANTIFKDIISALITLSFFWLMLIIMFSSLKK